MFVALSTTASIVQQMHYAVDWVTVKNSEYEQARELGNEPAAVAYTVLGPRAQLIPYLIRKNKTQVKIGKSASDHILHTVEFYSYNVLVLLILFWFVQLSP